MTRAPLRIGLAGCGGIARRHIAAWAQVPEAQLVALAEPDATRLRAASALLPGAACHGSLEAMLAAGGIDAVDICTGPAGRRDLVAACLSAGLPVLIQKPMATTLAEAEAIAADAANAGVPVMVKETWRFSGWYRAIARELAAGRLGPVRLAEFRRTCWGSADPDWPVWREQPYFRTDPQALWFDVGGHFVDVVRHLLGEPLSVTADILRFSELLAGDDLAHVVLRLPQGLAICHLAWCERGRPARPGIDRVHLTGRDASLTLGPDGRMSILGTDGDEPVEGSPFDRLDDGHVAAQRNFARGVLGYEPFATPAAHNARTLAIVLAAYASNAGAGRVACGPQ